MKHIKLFESFIKESKFQKQADEIISNMSGLISQAMALDKTDLEDELTSIEMELQTDLPSNPREAKKFLKEIQDRIDGIEEELNDY